MTFMSEFLHKWVPDSNDVELTASLLYDCDRYGELYEVPCGFVSDCASIPKFLWTLLGHPFDYQWREEAVLHDFFYRSTEHSVSRLMADLIFFDGLRKKGLSRWRAWLMFAGVRVFGRSGWKKGTL